MEEWIALILDIGLTALVVTLIFLISVKVRKVLGSQPSKQSKMKRELFQSGDTLPAVPRRMYIDTYMFIAFFVLFDVATFIMITAFFASPTHVGYRTIISTVLVYSCIVLGVLLFAVKKKYARDVIEPLNSLETSGEIVKGGK